MPPSFTISPERRVVRLVYRGEVTFPEWKATMDAIARDPLFRPGFAFLIDRRSSPAPSAAFVEGVVAYLASNELAIGVIPKTAMVVSDPASFGMARMVQGLSGSPNMDVFTDIHEAERWLDPEAA